MAAGLPRLALLSVRKTGRTLIQALRLSEWIERRRVVKAQRQYGGRAARDKSLGLRFRSEAFG